MFKKLRKWWGTNTRVRKEYREFIAQCKKEQSETRKHRRLPVKMDVYDLQEGMLPKEYWKYQPKTTGKHFNDFSWPKTKKK